MFYKTDIKGFCW